MTFCQLDESKKRRTIKGTSKLNLEFEQNTQMDDWKCHLQESHTGRLSSGATVLRNVVGVGWMLRITWVRKVRQIYCFPCRQKGFVEFCLRSVHCDTHKRPGWGHCADLWLNVYNQWLCNKWPVNSQSVESGSTAHLFLWQSSKNSNTAHKACCR